MTPRTTPQKDSYTTEAQIFEAEAQCPLSTAANIETAKAMGQGVPPPGATLGWYYGPSRGGTPVYFYESNLEHESKMTREEGRCTRNTTGVQPTPALPAPAEVTPYQAPAADPAALMDGTVTEPPTPATDVASIPAPETPLVIPGSSHASPFTGEKLAAETPKSVEEIIAKARELLNELVGNALLIGFKNQLDEAIGSVNSVHGAPKLNYRCVRHLALVCELTDKVVKLMEQSSSF